jgi:hypothetical protein
MEECFLRMKHSKVALSFVMPGLHIGSNAKKSEERKRFT